MKKPNANTKAKQQPALSAEDKEAIADFRLTILQNTEHNLALDDVTILGIMNSKDTEEEAIIEALTQDKTFEGEMPDFTTVDVEDDDNVDDLVLPSTADLDANAKATAEKIENSEVLSRDIHLWVETDTARKRLPASIALGFELTFTVDELEAMPEPGLRYDAKDLGNKPFDVREAGKGSYYGDVARAMTEGRQYLAKLELIKQALSDKEETPDMYAGKTAKWLEAEQSQLEGQFAALRNCIKAAMKIIKRKAWLKANTLLRALLRTETLDGVKTVERTTVPIRVYYLVDDEETGAKKSEEKYVSVSTFTRVDLDKIAKLPTAAAQLDAFIVKKGGRGKNKAQNDNTVPIKMLTGGRMAEGMYELNGRFDDTKVSADFYKLLASDEGDEVLDQMFVLENHLKEFTRKPELQARVKAFRLARLEAEKGEQKKSA